MLETRQTPELVIGLVGPVGSGVTTTGDIIASLLQEQYAYEIRKHRVSSLILGCSNFLDDRSVPVTGQSEARRVEELQHIGDELRKKFGPDYLAKKVVEEIALDRLTDGYKKSGEGLLSPKPRRLAHIIDSFKNPAEVDLLRQVYGDVFFLIGVFAPLEIRRERLKDKDVESKDLDPIIDRDEDEQEVYGQKVRDTIHQADFFVRNDGENDESLKTTATRFLEILFNTGVHTPTKDESAMYSAISASSKSACLSRQVGAAIYSEHGEQIGIGWNDVPRTGGGLYAEEDGQNDHRCFLWGAKICHNDDRKHRLYRTIAEALRDEGLTALDASVESICEVVAKTEIRNLIEFSRSVHAEMEAIISVARSQKAGLVGATMYVTTFPCHNCARHIAASGIRKVVYIEPYPKSLALTLHKDTFSSSRKDKEDKVVCLQYEGIAPKNVVRLFRHGGNRKTDGKLVTRDKRKAVPVFPPPLDGFAAREQIIVDNLKQDESRSGGERDG